MQESKTDVDPDDASAEDGTRLCALTRERHPTESLIRFVADPNGVITPDIRARLPGRGVWITCRKELVTKAAETGVFARSLRRPVALPEALAEGVGRLLRRAVLDRLAMANKAGSLVLGYGRIEENIVRGSIIALVHGSDAAADGVAKLDARLARRTEGAAPASLRLLSIDELSLALGRPNVVHAALEESGASRAFLDAARRLELYSSA